MFYVNTKVKLHRKTVAGVECFDCQPPPDDGRGDWELISTTSTDVHVYWTWGRSTPLDWDKLIEQTRQAQADAMKAADEKQEQKAGPNDTTAPEPAQGAGDSGG